jgi:3-dehydroquinate synthetase
MSESNTKLSNNILEDLDIAIGNVPSESIYILVDSNTEKHCLPTVLKSKKLEKSHVICTPSGDANKNIDAVIDIWRYLSENGANRKSLMINIGGGVVTDMGGFAASTFKRGIDYINISTTLLGAVDAATGGKTGINFLGYKNEIGVFSPAKLVLIDVDFFRSLDVPNIRSGYAEMIKHALIDTREEWNKALNFDLEEVDFEVLKDLLATNLETKERIVKQDPKEENIRKALNLGHTFGHAFETFSYRIGKPLLHGYAVMWGLLCELYLSHIKLNFPKEDFLRLKQLIKNYYGSFSFDCTQYDEILELMTHDKKNETKAINFTLLSDIGVVEINQTATKDEIFECFDYLREGGF